MLAADLRFQLIDLKRFDWRRRPDLNRGWRFCRRFRRSARTFVISAITRFPSGNRAFQRLRRLRQFAGLLGSVNMKLTCV